MTKYLISALLMISAMSCQQPAPSNIKQSTIPLWAAQDIDSAASCDIIPCPGIKIITIGKTFTATYSFADCGLTLFKQNINSAVYFNAATPQWYSDSCQLKEELRGFIKLQMTKYFVNASTVQNQ